jgi:hypothetical protein
MVLSYGLSHELSAWASILQCQPPK